MASTLTGRPAIATGPAPGVAFRRGMEFFVIADGRGKSVTAWED